MKILQYEKNPVQPSSCIFGIHNFKCETIEFINPPNLII